MGVWIKTQPLRCAAGAGRSQETQGQAKPGQTLGGPGRIPRLQNQGLSPHPNSRGKLCFQGHWSHLLR
jgi:hypothetical protein